VVALAGHSYHTLQPSRACLWVVTTVAYRLPLYSCISFLLSIFATRLGQYNVSVYSITLYLDVARNTNRTRYGY
jgi:hypothetical protein